MPLTLSEWAQYILIAAKSEDANLQCYLNRLEAANEARSELDSPFCQHLFYLLRTLRLLVDAVCCA